VARARRVRARGLRSIRVRSWTISEWGSLQYGDAADRIPEKEADRIAAAARQSVHAQVSGERVLEHGRHALRARNFVGVVAAPGLALEILPKIDGLGDVGEAEALGRIRHRLVHMLAAALDLDIDAGRITALGSQKDNLLELLIRLFADKLMDAARAGLPRRYAAAEDDLPALRGRLDLVRQFTLRAAAPEKLACRYDEFLVDTPLNRVMKAAVQRLRRLARRAETQRRLAELDFLYADVGPIGSVDPAAIVLDRTNGRWRELLDLARLILGQRYQTTSLGRTDGFALLFDMQALFESYVAAMLRRAYAGSGMRVVSQGGRLFCLHEIEEGGTGRGRFQTKPDILLKRGDSTIAVLDTKWKRLLSHGDDPKHGVSQADIYQMIAYGRLYRCPSLVLVYPHRGALGAAEGVQRTFRVAEGEERLSLVTCDLADGREMPHRLRAMLPDWLRSGAPAERAGR
jgi:5-methylcytosine-specific restriction enzyme subunit McrC